MERTARVRRPSIVRASTCIGCGILLLSAAACDAVDARSAAARVALEPAPTAGADALTEVVALDSAITLQENDSTINVVVRAEIDPYGGFLVADEREGFVRRYARDGELLAQFGGKGHGPDEFPSVLTALRLPDGEIVVFDIEHKGAVFNAAGDSLIRTFRTPIFRLHAAMVVDDSLALLGGQIPGAAEDHRLHLWNLRTDSLLRSFFAPPMPSRAHRIAAAAAGWVDFDRHGDTLAVVTSLSDTVYLMLVDGTPLDRIPIPSDAFRRLDPGIGLPNAAGGIGEARRWISQFSLISHVHWLEDAFVIQYQDRVRPEPDWRVVGMTRVGGMLFEILDTPKLLASDSSTQELFFVAQGSETPNVWQAGRLRAR